MLIITDLTYLLSQKVPINIFSEEEKAIIYYDDKDSIPAKAFVWLSKLHNKIELISYNEIGGKDNISFSAGGYVIGSKTGSAVIVGAYDTEKRIIKIYDKEYKIYTTPDFNKINTLEKDEVKRHVTNMTGSNNSIAGRIAKMIAVIPDKAVPAGMDIESFARVLDGAIACCRGIKNNVVEYLEENLGRNISDSIQVLFSTGAYDHIVDIVLNN